VGKRKTIGGTTNGEKSIRENTKRRTVPCGKIKKKNKTNIHRGTVAAARDADAENQ